jgi:hypothetical protein
LLRLECLTSLAVVPAADVIRVTPRTAVRAVSDVGCLDWNARAVGSKWTTVFAVAAGV